MKKFSIILAIAMFAMLAAVVAVYRGANVLDRSQIPWFAQVETNTSSNVELLCAGAIFSPKLIITSGPCGGDLDPAKTVCYVGYLNYKMGKVTVQKLVRPIDYNATLNTLSATVIVLKTSLVFGTTINAVKLPEIGNNYTGLPIKIYGLGQVGTSDYSNIVRVGTAKSIWNVDCEINSYGRTLARVYDICIEKSRSSDVACMCDGDEGGPMMNDNTLVGIFKFNTEDGGPCEVHPDADPAVVHSSVGERVTKLVLFMEARMKDYPA